MRNRFCASFRMAENAKRTPELTRKVKNCNVPRNKIKSAIFWQKSYRLEWYLIICHYLNLYVHCISFITRLFLLWKLTGAKSNFETMCLQERNPKVNDLDRDLYSKNSSVYVTSFIVGHNFWTLRDRNIICDMYTQLAKPFLMIPRSMTIWPW